MKKLFAFIAALAILLGLCACGSAGGGNSEVGENQTPGGEKDGNTAQQLLVGYSRVNITPSYSLPLAGYGNTSMRMSTGFQTFLFTTCVAYSDGTDTVLVFQNDLSGAYAGVVTNVRTAIKRDLGIPETNVMIAGTHTHSAPDLGNSEVAAVATYRRELEDWMLQAAQKAVEDLKPATITYGSIVAENLNFVRHYTTESGVVKGDNFNDLVDSPYTGHVHKADNLMQVARIIRQDAPDVVLINWQSHPHRGGGGSNTNITADIVGVMRDYVEAEVDDVQFAYYTGASGNVNPSSRIAEENITANYWEQGKALGKHAVQVLDGEMTALSGTNVQILANTYVGQVNHTEDHLLNLAYEVQELWKKNNNFVEAVTLANSYGMNSPYHAGAIIGKAGLPATYDVEMYAISVGDLAFVTAPYEMYDENGLYIKEESPYPATFVITCCNNRIGYIPSVEGFANNTYEANNGKFVSGTGEALAEEYVKMLDSLYATR